MDIRDMENEKLVGHSLWAPKIERGDQIQGTHKGSPYGEIRSYCFVCRLLPLAGGGA